MEEELEYLSGMEEERRIDEFREQMQDEDEHKEGFEAGYRQALNDIKDKAWGLKIKADKWTVLNLVMNVRKERDGQV